MKKIIIVVVCVLNFIPLVASAQGKTKEERKDNEKLNYSIEYIPPMLKTDTAYTLLVKFYTKVTAQQAETTVRSELCRILKNSPPKSDILTSAWYVPTNKPNDESPILLPDGSPGLIYSYKRGKTLTTKEYSSAELPSPNVSKLIIVKFSDVQFQVNQDGRAVVVGTTNLPDGASIMIWIRNINYGGAQSRVTVNQGKFISELFSDRGNKLPSGEYEVDISLSYARLQSPEVQNIIGQKGENLSGEFVQLTDLGAGNVVDFSKNLIIPDSSYPHTIISSQEFGDAWPFTVSQGILVCKGSGGIGEVVFIANGKEYAVNGVARANRKYRNIKEIYAGESLGPIINRGLELCK